MLIQVFFLQIQLFYCSVRPFINLLMIKQTNQLSINLTDLVLINIFF